jgi:hypothetical protein
MYKEVKIAFNSFNCLKKKNSLPTNHIFFIEAVSRTTHISFFNLALVRIQELITGTNLHTLFYYYRIILAALHFNENAMRQQASTKDGRKRYAVFCPK